jgi:hypothetical protein
MEIRRTKNLWLSLHFCKHLSATSFCVYRDNQQHLSTNILSSRLMVTFVKKNRGGKQEFRLMLTKYEGHGIVSSSPQIHRQHTWLWCSVATLRNLAIGWQIYRSDHNNCPLWIIWHVNVPMESHSKQVQFRDHKTFPQIDKCQKPN